MVLIAAFFAGSAAWGQDESKDKPDLSEEFNNGSGWIVVEGKTVHLVMHRNLGDAQGTTMEIGVVKNK